MYTEKTLHKIELNSEQDSIDYCRITVVYRDGEEITRNNWRRAYSPSVESRNELIGYLQDEDGEDNSSLRSAVYAFFSDDKINQ